MAKAAVKTYRAKERGYVDGRLIEAGEVFSTAAPRGAWMEPTGKESAVEMAAAAAVDPQPDDVPLENLGKAALEALAFENGIDPKGLSKDELVNVLKGAHDKNRAR